jgi:hypothetical protein
MLVDQPIPNLFGGVSQQPALARFPNQLEAQINCIATPVEGLRKRPPTEHVKHIINAAYSKRPAAFAIDRDQDHRYEAVIGDGVIRVFDVKDGSEKGVLNGDDSYFQTTGDPATALRALTVADYTFILNREKAVAATDDHADTRPFEAIIFVRAGAYGRSYSVTLKDKASGTTIAGGAWNTPDGSSSEMVVEVATDFLAQKFYDQMNATLPAGMTLTLKGSVLYVSRDAAHGDFTIECEDGQGKQALRVYKDEVQRFTDLPEFAVEGFTVKITGDQTSSFDDYYVRYNGTTWEETIKPGETIRLNAATLPRALVHNAEDDTFTVIQLPWVDRKVGDADNNPFPSFTGLSLNGIFYFRDRLGFLADENIILSKAGDYFNFFRTTMTDLLDDDPIDVTANTSLGDNSAVAILEHALAFDKRLFITARNAQYILGSITGPLTPSTEEVDPVTAFACSATCRPVSVGRYIYFPFNREGSSGIREFSVDNASRTEDAEEVTSHVPTYLPGDIRQMSASTLENIVVAVPPSGNKLFAYNFFRGGDEKLESAWGEWHSYSTDDILSCNFFDNVAYMIVGRVDGYHLERMRFTPGLTDSNLPYYTMLDRRVSGDGYTATYDAVTDKTTLTVPWPVTVTTQVVTLDSPTHLHAPGQKMVILAGAGYALQIAGDKRAWKFVIGVPYTMSFDLTKPFYVRQSTTGEVANTEAVVKVRDYSLDFAGTGYFTATFKPYKRDPYTKVFTGQIAGSTPTDTKPLDDGTFRIKTPCRNIYWALTIENDSPFPSRFLAAAWRGNVESKSQRV